MTIVVELVVVAEVAVVPPKLTTAPTWKFVPVIVTEVPPAVEPELGASAVIAGAGDVGALTVMKPTMFECPFPHCDCVQT